uniref:WD repeat-containing protein 64-like n=1 Tax=Styela clava TaxID=7725 RepID=UPI001939FE84|nr:WD repeat-containing protein 64-like [Styela clava]
MATTMDQQEPLVRPLSMTSFQRDLEMFEEYIAEVTMQDSDASVDEKRQKINETLRYEPFCENIRLCFGPDIKTEDMKAIFRKISTNPEVKIDWSEVFGYFQAENEETDNSDEISVFTVSKRKKIGEAAGDKKRRDIIQCISYSPEYDLFVTASQKGAISIYNGKLRLQNCIDVNEPAWMTSCEYLPRLRKVIATTERTIVIWDHRTKANNQSSIYVIKPLEHSPQCMCLLPPEDDHTDSVLIGDDAGYVNLVRLTPNDFAASTNKDPKRAMMSQVIDPMNLMLPIIRRKFHPDWVLKIEYISELKSFASCSPSDKTSFVIAEKGRLFDTQPVSELTITRGVNAFAYSEKSNIFATGGVDKIIRVWHPTILTRPTGKMMGHLFTIIAVVINDKDRHIISLSTARVFRVWDIHTLSCLQVFTDTEQRSGDKRISCLLFDSRHDRLFTGSSSIDLWPMTRSVQDTMSVPHTHDHPLTLVVKNKPMDQVITACSESIVKVWEIDSGRQMYQILEAHGLGIEVTASGVDETGTRMLTGAYDGSIKIWEFSSGQEMKSYQLDPPSEEDNSILWISYLDKKKNEDTDEQNENKQFEHEYQQKDEIVNRRILALGWNNRLKEFEDSDENDDIRFVREFSGTYEWPPTPQTTPEPGAETASLTGSVEGDSDKKTKKKTAEDDDDKGILRKEDLFLRHEITCCSMMDVRLPSVSSILVTGCSNGNIILWNPEEGTVSNVFELEKAEVPSRYDSRERRMKEMFPYRVNQVAGLCHKIFVPDPEEVKRRRKLRKKKMLEIEGGLVDDEAEEDEEEKTEQEQKDDAKEEKKEEVDDDRAEEAQIDVETSDEEQDGDDFDLKSFEERQLMDIDPEPIKKVEVEFPPVIASCHQDSNVRLWSMTGELLVSLVPMTKVVSPITTMCNDEYSNYLIVGDTKGYVTMWDVSEFLQKSNTGTSVQANTELVRQIISWRAHLMKIVSVVYGDEAGALITASTDGSVRIWYPQRAHYVGYFGQHRVWYLSPNPSLPSSPVLPYDINEVPVKPVNIRSGRRKPQTKKYDYPLIFDAERWKPFRRSAYDRDLIQRQQILPNMTQPPNVLEVRNKKFFKALVKPKADKSSLESSKPAEPESGAIFRALPVYRLQTPPPQPRAPSMDFVTGGASFTDDPSTPKSPGKSVATGKVSKGRVIVKKPSSMAGTTPILVAGGTPKRRR